MDAEFPNNLTLTTGNMELGLSSAQSHDLNEFPAFFGSSCATSKPLDAAEFTKAQDLWMMEDFYSIQNSFKDIEHDQSCSIVSQGDQDQLSSVSAEDVAERSSNKQKLLNREVDGLMVIADPERAVEALSMSQITTLEIKPMSPEMPKFVIAQVNVFEVRPKTPQISALAMSRITSLDLKARSPGATTTLVSLDTSLNLSQKAQRNPALLTSPSATEIANATHTLSSGTDEAPQSRTQRMKGLLGSSDHPIVICDEMANGDLKRKSAHQPTINLYSCKRVVQNKQPCPPRTNSRVRLKPERGGIIEWVQYEQKILYELRDACQSYSAYWEQVRDLPDLATNARVQQHDRLVRRFVKVSQGKPAELLADVDKLRKSYTELRRQIMPQVENKEGRHLLKQLSRVLDVVYNRSEIAHNIRAQCKIIHHDKEDRTYCPSKRQRRV